MYNKVNDIIIKLFKILIYEETLFKNKTTYLYLKNKEKSISLS